MFSTLPLRAVVARAGARAEAEAAAEAGVAAHSSLSTEETCR